MGKGTLNALDYFLASSERLMCCCNKLEMMSRREADDLRKPGPGRERSRQFDPSPFRLFNQVSYAMRGRAQLINSFDHRWG